MVKLTKTFVEKVDPPANGHTIHWDGSYDGAVKGYGLRVSSRGKRVFIAMGRVHGKQVQFTIGPFGQFTEKVAREKAQTILQQMRDGIDPRDGKKAARAKFADDEVAMTTLEQVLETYHARGKLKDSTKAEMRRHIEKVFGDWKDKPIASITERMCRERHREMAQKGLRSRPAPGQAQISMVTLRTLMNFAMRRFRRADGTPLIVANPVLAIRDEWTELKPRTRDIDARSVGTAWYTLQTARSEPRNRDTATGIDLTMFLLLTGSRRMEGAALTWDRVHLSADPADCWWHLPDPKNRNPVYLPLSTQAVAILNRRKAAAAEASEDEDAGEPSPFVFPSRSAKGHVTDTRAPMERVSAAVGMDKLSAHDLRRTFVSIGFTTCGIDLFKMELLTNHKPTGVTAKHYLQTSRLQYLHPEAQRIGDWIEHQGAIAEAKATGANVVTLRG
ncbi:tyrosine-type recombinase/integrase [Sphingomonas sp. M1-B02]|uniref:tyrosine-type recombinase/integrase n=1 Tax=Sphingomonas sp. M1-B02 TaxID=3114300 RepID=UPI00223F8C30|nr:integrase family protein [Sphingomonas sp. S6-11]UZK65872.1 integrase family protein [Sphingomonas sp. S6-11]